jgi:hypothetical protein
MTIKRTKGRIIMLSDFLTLELYFGSDGAALYFEDLAGRYSPARIHEALAQGDLHIRLLHIGPETGRRILWLSEQGRRKAQAGMVPA